MNQEAQQFYQQEFDLHSQNFEILTNQIKNFSRIRLIWFLVGIMSIYFASTTSLFLVGLLLIFFVIVFLIIAIHHERLIVKKKKASVFLNILRNELDALDGDVTSYYDGKEFIDNSHPYASDLDLFGKESLFQMLNRNFSIEGNLFLVSVLNTLEKDADKIRSRQKAIKELSEKPKWVINFRAFGLLAFTKESSFSPDPNILANALPIWIKRRSIFQNRMFKYLQLILPILSIIIFVLYLFGSISSSIFILYLFINLGFTGFYTKKINQQHQELSKQSDTLFSFQTLILHIENEEFKSDELLKIHQKLFCKTDPASRAIRKLSRIIQSFDSRLNILAWPILNYFLLWDIRQSIRLEQWKSTYQNLPSQVFKAIAEMEVIASLSTFKYNRNDLIFPEIIEDGFIVEGKELGHPLINSKIRVDNNILFSSNTQFYIITGANMAGKSTYLRTIGVNLVLALSGAPGCAKQFKTSVLQPFTSIKTSDSLSNNESYFYSELLRLQRIIEALKTGESYFIILDEILKGTNSKDKEQGSKNLVKQLIELKATGIIATHDLQLAELSKSFPENVKTACFEVEIENDQLVFDYKLRDGVSQNLNATFLMKKMGIS